MLKTALFDYAINEKCCSVYGGRGICPLFSSPPRGIWQLKIPHPREFAIQGKKSANARGSARGALGAAGIDWCINVIPLIKISRNFSSHPFIKESRYLRTLNRGPKGVRNNESWLFITNIPCQSIGPSLYRGFTVKCWLIMSSILICHLVYLEISRSVFTLLYYTVLTYGLSHDSLSNRFVDKKHNNDKFAISSHFSKKNSK